MQRNNLPLFFMLIAGVLVSIVMVLNGYQLHVMLFVLLITLLIFYGFGCVMRWVLNRFEVQNRQAREAEEKEREALEVAQKAQEALKDKDAGVVEKTDE